MCNRIMTSRCGWNAGQNFGFVARATFRSPWIMWKNLSQCGSSPGSSFHWFAHFIHTFNLFGYSPWWFVPIAADITSHFSHLWSFSHQCCVVFTLSQMQRLDFDQLQQEKLGFFLGAFKLGSDWWWVLLCKLACLVTSLCGRKEKKHFNNGNFFIH